MRHVRSSEPPSTRYGRNRPARRAMWAVLAAATTLVAACTGGGGSTVGSQRWWRQPECGRPIGRCQPGRCQPGNRLPRGADHDRRAVRGRRTHGHGDAPDRGADERHTRAAGRRAERRRRWRDPGGRTGRHGGSRRLHRADAPHRDVHGPVPVRRSPVRPPRRLQDDRSRDRGADDDHRPQGLRADDAPGARRLRQGQPGHGHLCQRGDRGRFAPVWAAVHERDRYQADRGPVRRNRTGDGRPRRQPGRLHVRPDDQHDRADHCRRGQAVRHHQSRAERGAA